jgi:ParB family chromosome partitioning protein
VAAIEEHKPVEKRRALGRGLESLLPSGPRVVAAVPTTAVAPVAPPPVVIPAAVAPVIAEPGPELVPTPGEIAEIHAARERAPLKPKPGLNGPPSGVEAASGPPSSVEASRAGAPAPHLPAPHVTEAPQGQQVIEIPLDQIDENPYQTRRTFDEAALNELAESIKANGLAQPVVVRPGASGRYLLVLGERRCRASRLAGKTAVPAIVRMLGNEQAAEMTIVENLQRQDLNCLEQAQAFARLSKEFNLTQEQIGQRTGVSRESVANYLRMLKLPKPVLDLIGAGKLGFSEARVLLEAAPHVSAETIIDLASMAVRLDLTVRDLKQRVEYTLHPELHQPEPPKPKTVDPNVVDAERQLRESLGMRVRVMAYQGNKGQVVIRYESLADFDRILERLSRDV